MAKIPGDPHDPGEIIELTDIIEHGPGAPKAAAGSGGVDASFERELEDLFADVPPESPAKGDPLAGLEDLHIPESGDASDKSDPDIDLEGLDDLLAAAEQSQPTPAGDLPELPDDFSDDLFDKPLASDLPDPSAGRKTATLVSAAPADDLTPRLDALEASMASLSDSLPQTCLNTIEESLATLKAEIAQAPDPLAVGREVQAALQDEFTARLAEAAAEFTARLDALKDDFTQALADVQELSPRIAALEAAQADTPQPPADDSATLASDLAALADDVAALKQDAPTASALTETVTAQVLASLPQGQDHGPELVALRAELDALKEHAQNASAPVDSETERLATTLDGLDGRLAALESAVAGLSAAPEPDNDLEERFAALKAQLVAEVEKAVPQAAARIIREEIQALLAQDME